MECLLRHSKRCLSRVFKSRRRHTAWRPPVSRHTVPRSKRVFSPSPSESKSRRRSRSQDRASGAIPLLERRLRVCSRRAVAAHDTPAAVLSDFGGRIRHKGSGTNRFGD